MKARTLTDREIGTILAALRYWQQDLEANDDPPISEHFEDVRPLTADEVDDLCERLNCAHVVTMKIITDLKD